MNTPAATRFSEKLVAAGFLLFGGFKPEDTDLVPETGTGSTSKTLLIIGSTGPGLWPAFKSAPEAEDGQPDPMDRYTRRVLSKIADGFGFQPLFPFDGPPYHPFQKWALKCGGFSQSPFGLLTHTRYGPWAGLRAAFLSADDPDIPTPRETLGPCVTCQEKPCLTACPVDAIQLDTGYDVPRCLEYLGRTQDTGCWSGCQARKACPVGQHHAPDEANGRFHMKSFVGVA
ncbi:hypothetical protein [Roseibium alexandrii]|uniref:hypothetical protein n=1 Tax=Roseibium alexandrii TaxID=388408 RepID=UPI00375290F8